MSIKNEIVPGKYVKNHFLGHHHRLHDLIWGLMENQTFPEKWLDVVVYKTERFSRFYGKVHSNPIFFSNIFLNIFHLKYIYSSLRSNKQTFCSILEWTFIFE